MIVEILVGLAVVLVILVIFIATRSGEFRVDRSLAMGAPPEAVFPHVNSLRKWEAWSPWAKLDPNAKGSFEGPEAGVGAVMTWAGNNKVGEGRMTVVASQPAELVRFKLEFFKPMKAINTAEFTFKRDGARTVVTWCMTGENNFMGKAFGLVVDCDKMVGGQFEKGLADLKAIAETGGSK